MKILAKYKIEKIFKAVISVCIIALIAITLISCSKTTTTTTIAETSNPPTTVAPTSTVAETTITEVSQAVEYQGEVFGPIEFAEINSQTGEIFALDGNSWGVEAGTKIGQCLIDAIEVNGQKENSIAFIAPVIEYLEKAEVYKEQWLQIPIPFDLTKPENKGIKMDFVKEEKRNEIYKDNALEQNFSSWHIIAPVGAKMLSSFNVKASIENDFGFNATTNFADRDDFYGNSFHTEWNKNPGLLYKGEKFLSALALEAYGVKLEVTGEKVNRTLVCITYLGEPIFEVAALSDANPEQRQMLRAPENVSFLLYNEIGKKKENGDGYLFLQTGENMLLSINSIKVSILSGETAAK